MTSNVLKDRIQNYAHYLDAILNGANFTIPITLCWNAVIKKVQIKWYWQILVQGRFMASTFLFLVKGRWFSGVNKVRRSDNTNFFVSQYKECLDGQPGLLLLLANDLTAVPDTKGDIFALQYFLCGVTRKPDCSCFAPCLAPGFYQLTPLKTFMVKSWTITLYSSKIIHHWIST